MEGHLVVSARLEEGIPKLLVKVSPATAANNTKNLGEVTLKKLGSGNRSHVAVVHLSASVPTGIVLISSKLAELLGVTNGEQVQIARSERVSRRGSKEEGEGATRSQSKQAGSLPPETRQGTWSESPLFAQGRNAEAGHRRTVHGGRILGTPQAKVAEELPEHLSQRHGYVPRMASVASQQGFHHPPMPVASKVGHPSSPQYHPVYAQSHPAQAHHAHARAVPSQCNSPGVAVRMTRVPQPANFAFHMARPKAAPKVQSARLSTAGAFGYRDDGRARAETADWLPTSCGLSATWQATQRQVPPSSPPALVPKPQKAESRSPSPPHTPARSPPGQGDRPMGRARTDGHHPTPSPKFFQSPPPFERLVSEDTTSPSPPWPKSNPFSPQKGLRMPPTTQVERRFSLPAESPSWLAAQELAAAMAPVPQDRPVAPWPVNPPPLKVAVPMVQPPPPAASPKMVPKVEPKVENEPTTMSTTASHPAAEESQRRPSSSAEVPPEAAHAPEAPEAEVQHVPSGRRASRLALVPIGQRDGRVRSKHLTLGALQCNGAHGASAPAVQPLNDTWRPPNKSAGGSLERSELGSEITLEVRRWLKGQTSGLQCSHVVMDKALTVLSNFKLSSGCELEVLGGPLGAIIGGFNEEDWLYQEIFSKDPGQALQEAFQLLGFPSEGDWSGYMVEEISLAYRRQCLRGHPSRGGSARHYLKLQVAMELIRAFDQELPEADVDAAGQLEEEGAWSPMTRRKRKVHGFVLDDLALVRELELSQTEAAMEADTLPVERLEELNRALDEYILRQMCFKSEIVAEIARLHENSAYSILGVSPEASDAEIKKAYRLVAMQCHPDKGGDKAEFQELHEAYEKIMEQRRSSANLAKSGGGPNPESTASAPETAEPAKSDEDKADEEEDDVEGEEEADEKEESEHVDEEDGGDAQLLSKSGKAAEEASRYAKTAADFAHQAAEAAETARQGKEGNALALTKSIAHSAIVLTLTVVKAVRVVGYATMDVAAQCRLAARKCNSAECAECSTEAMGLGLEALNAALSCAEVTEATAAELSRDLAEDSESGAAERFIGAAVRASLAAASASNAAMSAAIAAVEGNRQCIQAAQPSEDARDPQPQENEEEKSVKSEDETARSDHSEPKASNESPEEQGLKRQINQRSNNHKVLIRLNAEILLHQQNVRQFLQANRQLIPEVSCEAKGKVQTLLRDYAHEVQVELQGLSRDQLIQELPNSLKHSGLLAPLLQRQVLAIPVCPKARVLKMAALYDLQMTFQVLQQEIFEPARQMLLQVGASTQSLDEVTERIHKELQSYTDEG